MSTSPILLKPICKANDVDMSKIWMDRDRQFFIQLGCFHIIEQN